MINTPLIREEMSDVAATSYTDTSDFSMRRHYNYFIINCTTTTSYAIHSTVLDDQRVINFFKIYPAAN